jgi:hypothetical protein
METIEIGALGDDAHILVHREHLGCAGAKDCLRICQDNLVHELSLNCLVFRVLVYRDGSRTNHSANALTPERTSSAPSNIIDKEAPNLRIVFNCNAPEHPLG